MIDLGTFGGRFSWASSLTTGDYVVGYSYLDSNSAGAPYHAFLWHDDNMNGLSDASELRDLGTLGGNYGIAYDINSSHDVVGFAETAAGNPHALKWHDDNANG